MRGDGAKASPLAGGNTDMRILQRLFREVLIDFVTKAFTFDNLKIARDLIVQRLNESADNTETQIDDWLVVIVEKILNDENLNKIYQFIIDFGNAVDDSGLCKAALADYKPLALAIADQDEEEIRTCGALSLSTLLKVLDILIPILIDWKLNAK